MPANGHSPIDTARAKVIQIIAHINAVPRIQNAVLVPASIRERELRIDAGRCPAVPVGKDGSGRDNGCHAFEIAEPSGSNVAEGVDSLGRRAGFVYD